MSIELKALIPLIEKYSPDLAKLLPPPFGILISYGLSTLFGAETGNVQDLANKIQNDPNAAFKLKQFEIEHQDLIAKLNSSDFQAQLVDTQDARARDVKETQLTGKRDWVMEAIALIVVIGFFGMAVLVAVTKFDQSDHDVLYTLIGQMAAGFISVLSFFFGNMRKP